MCGDERRKGKEELGRGKEGGKKGGRGKDRREGRKEVEGWIGEREGGKEEGRGEVEMQAVSYKIPQG